MVLIESIHLVSKGVALIFYEPITSFRLFTSVYGGTRGIFVFFFGSSITLKTQVEVMCNLEDEDALAFKKWMIDECNMTAITGAIIAQLVISSLSLDRINETHWLTRACLVYSLVASLMAVYFAATQSRKIGRLFKGKDIRSWLRKGRRDPGEEFLEKLRSTKSTIAEITSTAEYTRLARFSPSTDSRPIKIWALAEARDVMPALASIVSLSAPSMLLSTSLFAFLSGIGVYLGILYTKRLGLGSGVDDDRNVFIIYILGLGVCGTVYYIASSVTTEAASLSLSPFLAEFTKLLRAREEMLAGELAKWWAAKGVQVDANGEGAQVPMGERSVEV
ncbi:hypothetical protein TWF718_006652 [Orbilia javanica]|uniref:Uncharacterized protein n=1 Tax=Orbilia javanica TaxID=47235 RepID=A0AAN8MX78_9PEZI